jgi:uncharacterized protein YbjT (DUF2867 family)
LGYDSAKNPSAAVNADSLVGQVPYTAIHLPAYYENFLGFPVMTPRHQADGSFVFNMPIHPDKGFIPLFSVADSGPFVLEALRHPEQYLGKQIRVASESLSSRQLAEIFEKVTGWNARAEETNHEAFRNSFPGAEELYLNLKWFADNPKGLRDIGLSRRIYPQMKDWACIVRDNIEFFKNLPVQ